MTLASVKLWGTRVGGISIDEGKPFGTFQYDPDFIPSGIEISPISMPLASRPYTFPALPQSTFKGLPGLVSDSLPDKFGNALIDTWLARQGRSSVEFNAVDRLCYIGTRGMGALEYEPLSGPSQNTGTQLNVAELVDLASDVLSHRDKLRTSFADSNNEQAVKDILQVGTSAGGARAKAVIAWNPETNEVRSGQVNASGFEYWLLKFDGVSDNRDKELNDPQGFGCIEMAYSLMAKAAGIQMSDCRLFEENGRRHFMTKRFDRLSDGSKLHMQSLCAMAHFDFNAAGAHSYEQALLTLRQLKAPMADLEEQFRRMAFNIVARNQDDHVKNIAFLMDRNGTWSLSPAFDVTYSFNPDGAWTSQHQMSLNAKRDHFTIADFKACAQSCSMKRGRATKILDEVRDAVLSWNTFADQVGIDKPTQEKISRQFRLDFPTK